MKQLLIACNAGIVYQLVQLTSQWKRKTHSPRGRINLVKMAAEGKIDYSDLEGPINLCLGCRACEVVCPTNVQYGDILESAQAVLREEDKKQHKRTHTFKDFMFNQTMENDTLLSAGGVGVSLYQKSGLQKVAHKTKLINILPKNLTTFEKALPEAEGFKKRRERKAHYPTKQEPIYKVGFYWMYYGCDVLIDQYESY